MAKWEAPNMWQGGPCYIIAGGPSMPRQFNVPEEVIQSVMRKEQKPSAYSSFLEPIHKSHVIGVNNAYQIGNWIDVVFFGDCAWYLTHKQVLANFPGLKVTCCNRFAGKTKEQSEGVKYLAKNQNHKLGITEDKSKISWNFNSGAASINVAIHFGVKRIILLGFDMNLDANNVSHWHGSHGNPNSKTKNRLPPFKRHLKGFPSIAADATRLGVEIINANPESAIDVFPKMSVKELL